MQLEEIEKIVERIYGAASEEQIDRCYEELWFIVQKQREEIRQLKEQRDVVRSP